MSEREKDDPDRANIKSLMQTVTPTFGAGLPSHQIKATWMGHASWLVEMPVDTDSGAALAGKDGARGVTILFDPAYSDRASPVSFSGPAPRYARECSCVYDVPPCFPALIWTALPFKVDDLPEVDIIVSCLFCSSANSGTQLDRQVLSHNHYDHLDTATLTQLYKRFASRPPAFFVPLNNTRVLPTAIPRSSITELDWWEDSEVEVAGKGKVKITCGESIHSCTSLLSPSAPAQHQSSRYGYDSCWSLWSSWAVKHVPSDPSAKSHSVSPCGTR